MSQLNYKDNIVLNLQNKDNHVRGLAKDLGTNQTTIARKVKELEGENIVEFREEGRNKVYFLRNSLETREYFYLLEHKKFLQVVYLFPVIRKIVKKIKKDKKIKLAILFGSYVKKQQTKNSDIDVYIETQDLNVKKRLELMNSKLSVKVGKYDSNNLLVKEIRKNHVILKGVERYYEKESFFV
jgi:predicted nucleotidyltransferase